MATPPAVADQQNDAASVKDAKPPAVTRSWRKKYRKLRLRFSKVMDDSTTLFKEEHRVLSLARRLQEENDQLLEMLLEARESGAIDEHLEISSIQLDRTQESDVNYALLPKILSSMTHNGYTPTELPDEMVPENNPAGFLDPIYEDEYLSNLDSQLVEDMVLTDMTRTLRMPPSRMLPSDKDLANQNSDSVLSWLRRHHPETFIQEKDAMMEKPPARGRGGGGKRSSLAQASTPANRPAEEEEPEDYFGAELEKGSGRGKRSKDDDAYRPKGGSRGKRKRLGEDGDRAPGRGKRAKAA